ncbi:hypothetical protein Tco_1103284 [Tanacetum coccineum]
MAVLKSCPKHNMVAYLEKTDGNAEFQEIIDFLTRSSIHYALTGKYFSGKVTPLFPNMLVQPIEDEGEGSERPSKPQPTPSPHYPSEAHVKPQSDPSPGPSPTIPILDPIPEGSGGNLRSHNSSSKNQIFEGASQEVKKQARPFILHHKAWLKTVKRKNQHKKKVLKKSKRRSVFKQGKKTVKSSKGTDMPKVSTARTKLSTDKFEEGTAEPEPRESTSLAAQTTPTPTPTTFGDDETIAQVLLNMSQAKSVSKEKEKGVKIRNAKKAERPMTTLTRSVLILKPLPKIDPNDKGKKRIEEDKESEEITEAKKNFDQIAHDEEVARKIQEEWEAEEERKRLTEEEATKTALSNEYDFIQARIKADRLLAERVQEKHANLKTKSFDEIKALYEKVKRFDDSFITIGSTEDERKIKEMNEGASDLDNKKKFVKEDVSTKVLAKLEVVEQGTKKRKGGHMKMIARKRKRRQPDVDSDDEHRKCLKIVTFEGTIDSEIMERKSFISKLDKVSSPEGDYLVVYIVNGNFRAFNYLMEELHIFDRQYLFHLYDLVIKQYSESTPEGDFWNDQQDWEIVTWRLYEACGVCILEFKDGTIIHMLVERKYPLSKELLQRMLDFRLEVDIESTAALDLIRVLNSPCFMVKSWLVQDQTVLGKDYSNMLIADSLLKTIWFINAPCYGNEALASPKANELTIPEKMAIDVAVLLKICCRRIAKDVKETLRSDQDLSECLNTSSMKFKESTPKKHEVKQVQQSCLGEDCWELYIPDLVPDPQTGIPRTLKIRDEIFVTEHKLNEDKKITLVQQKKRGMAPEQSISASKEVEELKRAGILRETRYQTWVANTRLVDKVFESQIGRIIEAYIDDMVIKSMEEADMIANIQEAFERLQKINMNLNPKKCSFRMEEGQFMGYLVSKQGIKANPAKIQALTSLK